MKNRNLMIGIIIAVLALGGIWLYNWVLGPTQEASGTIDTIPLEVAASTPTAQAAEADTQPAAEEAAPATETVVEPTAAAEVNNTAAADAAGLTIYQISQAGSEVSFTIYEELRQQPVNVVGITNQVSGQIAVNPDDLNTAQVGVIQINARTLATDEDRRNQAIRNRILHTDQYEFITFTPTAITGLPTSAGQEEMLTFQITGDLTIQDVTQSVTFDVTAQIDGMGQLVGIATATITRSAYGLQIPSMPFVANVGDDITLSITFLAQATG